jgi:glycosyltransferase involved in cell wall biosynthesis
VTAKRSILEVCGYYGPYPGTFIPTLIAVGRAVEARLGLRYHCVFPVPMQDRPWVGLLSDAGITTSFLEDRLSALSTTRALSRIAASVEPALVRSHFSRWDLQAGVVARRLGAASVWHMHTGRVAQAPVVTARAKDLVKARLLGRVLCDRVFAVSGEIGRFAVSRGIPPARVEIVLNGIDVEQFSTLPARAAAREGLGLDSSSVVCLGFAWSPLLKGADILIDAATPLAEAGRLQVLLVGPRERLAPGPRPLWLHVVDPVDNVGVLFSAADCFVSASRDEGFSYAIGEAMAARLPVISSNLPGPSGYFAAGGVTTFASEDVAGLRAQLETMLAGQDRERAGEANREFVQAHFSIEAHVERVIGLFSELAEI